MTRRKGQDEVTRRARLNDGLCPTHGTELKMIDIPYQQGKEVVARVACPRGDCTFRHLITEGTPIWTKVCER